MSWSSSSVHQIVDVSMLVLFLAVALMAAMLAGAACAHVDAAGGAST